MLKASETPPPQRMVALQSGAEAPENTTKDVSGDEKETECSFQETCASCQCPRASGNN